jgi:ABC-type multidrug transport system fused ATPase/permease subunit
VAKSFDSGNTSFEELVAHVDTIRVFGMENVIHMQILQDLRDRATSRITDFLSMQWFALRSDCFSSLVLLGISCVCVWLADRISPVLASLSLLYTLRSLETLQYAIQVTTELQSSLVAVERIREWFHLSTEFSSFVEDAAAVSVYPSWPECGYIQVRNLKVLSPGNKTTLLSDLNFEIFSGEHVGICGRSGAGKSTLISTFFRMIPCTDDSSVLIDGIEIADVPIHYMRSRLAIVPQKSFFLSGSLRENLDVCSSMNSTDFNLASQ